MKVCLECGADSNIHDHHVIPKSMGGTKTIPLCEICHGKIHGLDFSNHGYLIRLGLRKSKKKPGRPFGSGATKIDIVKKHPEIAMMLLDNMSIRKIAKITKKGGSTVQRVKKALEMSKDLMEEEYKLKTRL